MVGITCTVVAAKNHFDKTVAGALEINKTTDTDLWKKAVKELANVKVAWKTSGSSKANTAAHLRMRRI